MHIYNCTGIVQYQKDIIDSEGCYVIDHNGHRYLDLEAGVWCLPLGHKHPQIVTCMKEQIDKITHVNYRYNHKIAEQAASKLLDITCLHRGKCVFLSSGSEAVDFGIRMARQLRPNKQCICLSNQYLSAYGFGSDTNTDDWMRIQWSYHDRKSEKEWLHILSSIDFEEIGVFVFEAGNSSGLVKLPPIHLVKAIVKKIHDVTGIIVVDEVTCGIGRTGKWFGYMHYGIKPDLIAIGKGLGSGYPISAVVMEKSVTHALEKINFHYAQSHQNDPLGCRIAYEVITYMERNNILKDVNDLGKYVRDQCKLLIHEGSIIEEVRGIGLMNCIQLSDTLSEQDMLEIEKYFIHRHIIVGVVPKEKCLRIYMPFIIEKAMIDHFIKVLKEISNR